jgi:hypothetical protein
MPTWTILRPYLKKELKKKREKEILTLHNMDNLEDIMLCEINQL